MSGLYFKLYNNPIGGQVWKCISAARSRAFRGAATSRTRSHPLVRGCGSARNDVTGAERGLFDFREVIVRIAVQDQFSDLDGRDFRVGPNFGDVENIPAKIFGLLGGKDLHFQSPRRVVSPFNGIEEVAIGMIGILPAELPCLLSGQVLDALVGLEMVLYPEVLCLFIIPFESVAAVPFHVTAGDGSPAVREENRHLMDGLRCEGKKVPEHVGVGDSFVNFFFGYE